MSSPADLNGTFISIMSKHGFQFYETKGKSALYLENVVQDVALQIFAICTIKFGIQKKSINYHVDAEMITVATSGLYCDRFLKISSTSEVEQKSKYNEITLDIEPNEMHLEFIAKGEKQSGLPELPEISILNVVKERLIISETFRNKTKLRIVPIEELMKAGELPIDNFKEPESMKILYGRKDCKILPNSNLFFEGVSENLLIDKNWIILTDNKTMVTLKLKLQGELIFGISCLTFHLEDAIQLKQVMWVNDQVWFWKRHKLDKNADTIRVGSKCRFSMFRVRIPSKEMIQKLLSAKDDKTTTTTTTNNSNTNISNLSLIKTQNKLYTVSSS